MHGLVSRTVAAGLTGLLRGSPGRVFTESLQLKLASELLFYPDVCATCGPDDLQTDLLCHASP